MEAQPQPTAYQKVRSILKEASYYQYSSIPSMSNLSALDVSNITPLNKEEMDTVSFLCPNIASLTLRHIQHAIGFTKLTTLKIGSYYIHQLPIITSFQSLKTLRIHSRNIYNKTQTINREFFIQVVEHIPLLEQLSITGYVIYTKSGIKKLSELKYLNSLTFQLKDKPEQVLRSVAEYLPNIETLGCNNCWITDLQIILSLDKLQKLKSVEFKNWCSFFVSNLTANQLLVSFLSKLKCQLQSITLQNNNIRETDLLGLFSNFQQIKRIHIPSSSLRDAEFRLIVNHTQGLKQLNLECNNQLRLIDCKAEILKLNQLQILKLNSCNLICDPSLILILQNCSQLSQLYLHNLTSNPSIAMYIRKLKSLRVLYFNVDKLQSGCHTKLMITLKHLRSFGKERVYKTKKLQQNISLLYPHHHNVHRK